MTAAQQVAVLVPVAYLLGSVPFGLIVGKSKGVDPRKAGSGNIGATNVGRLLGKRFFAIVFTLDLLKGLLPMLAAAYVLRGESPDRNTYVLWLAVGAAAILGHMFSLFLGFKGGKGVATSTGVLLGLWPYYTIPGLIGAAVWLVAFKVWRYVSLASILGSVAFPVAYVCIALALRWDVLGAQLPLLVFAVAMAALITYKHRSNIARLRAGTELRAGHA
jgi:acyl phosphate:glycerol-3-phosphate acyltransferase